MKIKKVVEVNNRSEYELLVRKASYKGYGWEQDMKDCPFNDSQFPVLILLIKKDGKKVMNFIRDYEYDMFFESMSTNKEPISVDEYQPNLSMVFNTSDDKYTYYSLIDNKNEGEIVEDASSASLNPEDEFNELFGVALCIARNNNDTVAERALMDYMYSN